MRMDAAESETSHSRAGVDHPKGSGWGGWVGGWRVQLLLPNQPTHTDRKCLEIIEFEEKQMKPSKFL